MGHRAEGEGQSRSGPERSTSESQLHEIRINKNEIGWDWRRLLAPWASGATDVEVHEPHLSKGWQHESVAFYLMCCDGVASVKLRSPRCQMTFASLLKSGAAFAGLESLAASYARLGLDLRVEAADFYRRRLVFHSQTGTVELGLDRILHGWRRPHTAAGRAALAARRTMDQHVLVALRGQVPPLPPPTLPTLRPLRPARLRRLLHEIELLRRSRLAGQSLRPAQVAKLARESALRHCHARRSSASTETWCAWGHRNLHQVSS